MDDLCVVKYNIFKNFVAKINFSPFTKFPVLETAITNLWVFEFTKVSRFIN